MSPLETLLVGSSLYNQKNPSHFKLIGVGKPGGDGGSGVGGGAQEDVRPNPRRTKEAEFQADWIQEGGNNMTIPEEELRALTLTRRFLYAIGFRDLFHGHSLKTITEIRNVARMLTRHYPYDYKLEELYKTRKK